MLYTRTTHIRLREALEMTSRWMMQQLNGLCDSSEILVQDVYLQAHLKDFQKQPRNTGTQTGLSLGPPDSIPLSVLSENSIAMQKHKSSSIL